MDFKDVTYGLILRDKDRYKGIHRWKMMAMALLGKSSKPFYDFLRRLEDISIANPKVTYNNNSIIIISIVHY